MRHPIEGQAKPPPVGRRVRACRIELDLSQVQFAPMLGLDSATLSELDQSQAATIAEVLGDRAPDADDRLETIEQYLDMFEHADPGLVRKLFMAPNTQLDGQSPYDKLCRGEFGTVRQALGFENHAPV